MAKRGRPRKSRLDKAAAGIGRTLGQVMNKMDRWRKQRDEIASDIRHVVGTGQKILAELGHAGQSAVSEVRSLQGKSRGGRRKGFKMSAAARAKISAAQKARWAKQKAGPRK